ncbi:MAG: hypothetical protein RL456_1125 [Pseudomonadota bacterium]|jgi:hypothetical protein
MADPVDLIFIESAPSPTARPVDLVFGALDVQTSKQTGTLTVGLPLPVVAMAASYDNNNAQRIYAGAAGAWRNQGITRQNGTSDAWGRGARAVVSDSLPWAPAELLRKELGVSLDPGATAQHARSAPWAEGVSHRAQASAPHDDTLRGIRPQAGGTWRDGIQRRAQTATAHADMLRTIRPSEQAGWAEARRLTRELIARAKTGARQWIPQTYPWHQGRRPPPGIFVPPIIEPPVVQPCYTPPAGLAVDLLFATAFFPSTSLVFKCRDFDLPGDLVIPFREVYMAVHTVTATTWPGLQPITLLDLTMSTDADSFCWTLSATGSADLMEILAPSAGEPAQVRITIDGTSWVFVIEGLSRDRTWPQTRTRVSGRSVPALIGAPWAPEQTWTNTNQILAAQIVAQALDLTGIAADWNLDDWLVPAGAWSHQGTPLSAVLRVAESIGAVVKSHKTAATLQIERRYPLLPWEWYGGAIAPDVQLPLAAVLRESYERRDSPAYNRAIVSGASQGVLGIITRAGTAGDLPAPMVTDALATAQEAVLQRGSAILGAAGPQATITLDLPILTGGTLPGVLDTNQLVEVIEPTETWRGMVRGVTVRQTGPKVRQSVVMERHL